MVLHRDRTAKTVWLEQETEQVYLSSVIYQDNIAKEKEKDTVHPTNEYISMMAEFMQSQNAAQDFVVVSAVTPPDLLKKALVV